MAYPANLRGWGQGWPKNRAGEMATVRTRHGQTVQVHREIAPIVQFLFNEIERRGYLIHKPGQIKDDWGYANRPIRGRNVASNHSWGLAFDIDATQYPMGTRRNPPRWIIDLIEAYGFEWGGRWSRPDPMHFEWRGSISEARHMVAMLAAGHLAAKPAPLPPSVPAPSTPPPYIPPPPPRRRRMQIIHITDAQSKGISPDMWFLTDGFEARPLSSPAQANAYHRLKLLTDPVIVNGQVRPMPVTYGEFNGIKIVAGPS